ncbi:methylated-DNA--[protein]-cysteine S-methyltransferase [uncultured Desulfovibrio sp.]|uniref:methylated-DNA--[protein]-cysteine S-methyltransferase n=1 Tax=uncultured Desulfovibrio sp. TaxID=167968 RepID=UPI0028059C82|nr:methylated-DNA--[protein]-cysteine S-methyltransferase [uncultured Desulfovibrio sp.]
MFHLCRQPSPLGALTLVSSAGALVGLWLEGQKGPADILREELEENPDVPVLAVARKWLNAYFAGERPAMADIPLAPAGSPFRQAVWKRLLAIPYGECVTYGQIARELAAELHKERMASQAVGGAVGHNPISIIIPCHRVVGSNGSLTGYAGGIDKKIRLLELEGVDMHRFFVPGTRGAQRKATPGPGMRQMAMP